MRLDQLHQIRQAELQQVRELIQILQRESGRERLRILEIGAGTGVQARNLAQLGHQVEAIDLPSSNYAADRVWPVIDYDGHKIPFPEHHFDLIFSSNVLEHIPHLSNYQEEMRRVLKPGGMAIHVLPSGSWRFWTNLFYYPHLCRRLIQRWHSAPGRDGDESGPAVSGTTVAIPHNPLFPNRHGVLGSNALTQIYYFSRRSWRKKFRHFGWRLQSCQPNRLFYTGYLLLEPHFALRTRQRLSHLLGSSCHIYLLQVS